MNRALLTGLLFLSGKIVLEAQTAKNYLGFGVFGIQERQLRNPVCRGPQGELYGAGFSDTALCFAQLVDSAGKTTSLKALVKIKQNTDYRVGRAKVMQRPAIACDKSNGQKRGRIYLCWSDFKFGAENSDVFLIYSDDKGENWTDPIQVSYRPNHKMQFDPELLVDPDNGDVYITYFDRQNFVSGNFTDVYLARSKNGGLKFEYYKLNASPIPLRHKAMPRANINAGHDDLFCVNWLLIRKHKHKYMASKNDDCDMNWLKINEQGNKELIKFENRPVYADTISLEFTLPVSCTLSLYITKPLEPGFQKKVFARRKYGAGKHRISINAASLGLSKDTYCLFFYDTKWNTYTWVSAE